MLFRLLISTLLLSAPSATFAQQWEWVDHSNGSSNLSVIEDLAVDSVRDVIYAVGYVDGNPNFSEIPNADYSGGDDGVVMKYDLNGNVQWGFLIGGSGDDRITGIAVDESTGNFFITGYLTGDNSSSGTSLEGVSPGIPGAVTTVYGNEEIFVAMYNVFGQLVWKRVIGGTGRDRGLDIALNSTGVFVTGIYENNFTLAGLPSSIAVNGSINNFVLALDKTDGSTLWNTVMGSGADDYNIPGSISDVERVGITTDDNGVYAINYFFGAAYTIYNSSGVLSQTVLDPNSSAQDYVVTAYSNTGAFNWSALYNNVGTEVNGIDITNDCEGVYVTGSLHDGSTTPGGTVISSNHDDVIISKLNKANGNEIWLKEFDSDFNHDDYFIGLHADGYGNLYAVGRLRGGSFSCSTDFNFTGGASNSEVMIAHYQTDGTFKDFEVLSSSNASWGFSIATYKNEKYVVGGYYNNTISFGSISPQDAQDNAFIALRDLPNPFDFVSAAGNQFFCQAESTTTPIINDNLAAGGSFSGPPQVVFNDINTGEIDLAASSTGGPFNIVYNGSPLNCTGESFIQQIYIFPSPPATFTYESTTFCNNETNPTPTSITTPGGTFSAPSGLALVSPSTGEINLVGSTPGTYWLVYTTTGSCSLSDSLQLTINAAPDPSFSYFPTSFCNSESNPIPSTASSGVFSAPAGLVMNTTTGEIDLAASTVGGPYTIKYVVSIAFCTDSSAFDVTINQSEDATFSYAGSNFCQNELNPIPTITGTSGGTFSGAAGLTIDPTTGEIDVAASAPGPYWVVYTTSGGLCPDVDSVEIFVEDTPDPSFAYALTAYCDTDPNPVPLSIATSGGTFSAPSGLVMNPTTGEIDLAGSTPGGPYTVQYVVTNTFCSDTATFDITINSTEDATFTYATTSFCPNDPNPFPTFIATPGGVFTSPPELVVDPSTGEVDVSASTVGGPYLLGYITPSAACPNSSSVQVTIEPIPDPTFAYTQTTYCSGGGTTLPNVLATPGGTFSAPSGLVINPTTGEIDLNASTVGGPYSIQYVTAATPCQATTTFDIIVAPADDASFAYATNHFCVNEANPTPTSIATSGGSFSGPVGLVVNSVTGEIDVAASTVGGPYWLVYTTPGPTCPSSDSIDVYIEDVPDASFGYDVNSYCQGTGVSILPSFIVSNGGSFSSQSGLIINSSTGEIDLDASTAGTYVVTYTVSNTYCQKSYPFTITIVEQDELISVAYSASDFCATDISQIPVINGASGTFTGPMSLDIVNTTTGEINPSNSSTGGPFTIQYVTGGACPDSLEIAISILDSVISYAGEDQELFFVFSTDLQAELPLSGVGEWSTTSGASIFDLLDPNSNATGLEIGENTFVWTVSNGVCPAVSDEVVITVQDIFIPQAVTPNNDGKNDFFELHSLDEVTCDLKIFNRWGQIVYENSNYENEWYGQNSNGDELLGDTYFYTIIINDSLSYEGFIVLKK